MAYGSKKGGGKIARDGDFKDQREAKVSVRNPETASGKSVNSRGTEPCKGKLG